MAFSLVLFPSTFANSVSVLLLPSISEASSAGKAKKIQKMVHKSIFLSLAFGLLCTIFFYLGGTYFGTLLFHNELAGNFIRLLSFLCPFLYLNITLNSILNGLKKTTTTLFINISSLFMRLFFVICYIPKYGIKSYLWGLLLSGFFSSLCSFYALRKIIF